MINGENIIIRGGVAASFAYGIEAYGNTIRDIASPYFDRFIRPLSTYIPAVSPIFPQTVIDSVKNAPFVSLPPFSAAVAAFEITCCYKIVQLASSKLMEISGLQASIDRHISKEARIGSSIRLLGRVAAKTIQLGLAAGIYYILPSSLHPFPTLPQTFKVAGVVTVALLFCKATASTATDIGSRLEKWRENFEKEQAALKEKLHLREKITACVLERDALQKEVKSIIKEFNELKLSDTQLTLDTDGLAIRQLHWSLSDKETDSADLKQKKAKGKELIDKLTDINNTPLATAGIKKKLELKEEELETLLQKQKTQFGNPVHSI